MKKSIVVRGLLIGLFLPAELLLASCARHEAAAPPVAMAATLPAGFAPSASMLDLMHDPIELNANALWEAVYTVSTTEGTKDVAPATDEEWLALRRRALVLMESANLLVVDGRKVANAGQTLAGAPDPANLTPEQAQAAIDKERPVFVGFSAALQVASGQLVAAIDSRDVEQYLSAGDTLQGACENCHQRYWYPEAPQPPGL